MKWQQFKNRIRSTMKFNIDPVSINANRERALRYRSVVGRLLLFAFVAGAAGMAHASRLESAASSAQGTITSIAQISSGIGIAVGGFLMSIGWSSAGRQVLLGAAIGAFASFGGPAIIEGIRTLF